MLEMSCPPACYLLRFLGLMGPEVLNLRTEEELSVSAELPDTADQTIQPR